MNKQIHSIKIMKALADSTRLSLVLFVARQNEPVASCDIVQSCARRLELSQPAMSHHFRKLVDANVLRVRKSGTENFYQVNRALLEKHGIDISKL